MSLWIKHPRSGTEDTMLTLGVLASLSAIGKFLLNGVAIQVADKTINFGTVDATLIAAILTPTLGAYVARKYTSNPDKTKTKKK